MLLLAAVTLALGAGLVVFGLSASRRTVRAAQALDGGAAAVSALGLDLDQEPAGAGGGVGVGGSGIAAAVHGGLLYRVASPVMDATAAIIRRLSPQRRIELTRKRIVYAGLEGTLSLDQHMLRKAAAAVIGLAVGFLVHPKAVPAILAALVIAALASVIPDVLLSSKASARQRLIGRDLPDALDLLSITVEAGLGLEQAISVVADKLTGPLGDELRRMLRELELGVDRRQALMFLRDRTDVPELSAFVVALIQGDELGVAISQILKVQAGQVRLIRRQHAREQAAKTPVKILFPLIIGIFPALFVVTVGPGAISIVKALTYLR